MNLKMYSVVPNVDQTGWFVKLEDAVPEKLYNTEDEAIEAATKMAQAHSPSKVEILDKNHKLIETKMF